MSIEMMISFIGTCIGFILSVLTLIIKLSKNKKVRRKAEQLLVLTEQMNRFIEEAEAFQHYTGAEKKEYVLTKLNQFSIDQKMKFDSEALSQKIDNLVDLTKQVNYHEVKKDWI